MTPQELYKALDKADLDYEVVEIFEGARWVRFLVDEDEEDFEPSDDKRFDNADGVIYEEN